MKKIIMLSVLCLSLVQLSVASNSNNDPNENAVVAKPEGKSEANLTYEQKAKKLANDIKQGFIETSKVPGITSCIAQGTQMYAGFGKSEDKDKAESITEFYLLMGEKEKLDLTDKEAVKAFLEKKLNERVLKNVEKGTGWFGQGIIQTLGQCIKVGGENYYRLRLNQALVWVFEKQVKDIGNTGLDDKDLLKEEK